MAFQKRKTLIISLVIVFCFGSTTCCHAVELFEGVWRALGVDVKELEGAVLGLGVLYTPSVYKDADDNVWPIPLIIGKYKRFYSDGSSFGYVLNDNNTLFFSLVGQPRFNGYKSSDSAALSGMEDRDWSLDGGLKMSWNNEWFLLNITGVTDLLSRHNGHELKAVVSKELFKGGLTPKLGIKWLSDNVVEYYYGVSGTEHRAERPAYEGGSSINVIAGFTLALPLGEDWAAITDFEYRYLGSEIEDSPIVDTHDDFTAIFGIVYRY